MTKSSNSKLSLFLLCLLIVFCQSCATTEQASTDTADKPKVPQPQTAELKPPPEVPAPDPNIVAGIGEYVITKKDLQKELMPKIFPDPYDPIRKDEMPDIKTVLVRMVANKAMIMEARTQNYLQDEMAQASINRLEKRLLVNLLLTEYLKDKVKVTDEQIDEKIKTTPNLSRDQAKAMLEGGKNTELITQFYDRLYKKLNVRKLKENYPEAARIYQRLLSESTRKYVLIKQMKNDVTPQEKAIVLVTYDGGQITLKDWFKALGDISPPSRPRNLHTPEGVEPLLDRILGSALFVAEARAQGLHRNKDVVMRMKNHEDAVLLSKVWGDKHRAVRSKPIPEDQIVDYFNKNKKEFLEEFGVSEVLKIDQIWCSDLGTAEKVKAELAGDADFNAVKQKYSLYKTPGPFDVTPSEEAVFFKDLWLAEPGEIVGPVKGFYGGTIKWRIVKIFEKKTAGTLEYSDSAKEIVQDKMYNEQVEAEMDEYGKQLLEKYTYQIYPEALSTVDPLKIP